MAEKLRIPKDHTPYMTGGDEIPFRCDHCIHYVDDNACSEEHIVQLAKKNMFGLHMTGSVAYVEPDACSDWFEPDHSKAEDDYDEEEESEEEGE